MNTRRKFLALVAPLFAVACGGPSRPSDVALVKSTTSFGFCVGYCRTTLEITSTEVTFVKEGWRGEPPLRRSHTFSSSEWNDLLGAIDRAGLQALPDQIGCPDCADGGAESVGVIATDWSKTVTFDHGADLPTMQALLDRVRAIRQRFEP